MKKSRRRTCEPKKIESKDEEVISSKEREEEREKEEWEWNRLQKDLERMKRRKSEKTSDHGETRKVMKRFKNIFYQKYIQNLQC
jgi:hypothetical protein